MVGAETVAPHCISRSPKLHKLSDRLPVTKKENAMKEKRKKERKKEMSV